MKKINESYLTIIECINYNLTKKIPARVYDPESISSGEQYIGAFQPVVSIINEAQHTFKPYNSWNEFVKDIFQPLRGGITFLKGFGLISLAILTFILIPIAALLTLFIKKLSNSFNIKIKGLEDYNFEKFITISHISLVVSTSSIIDGLLKIVRGISQILTTPLTWFLRIPLRGILTACYGTPDLFDNEDIVDLIQRSKNVEYDIHYKSYIVERLHYKFEKAINRGQETTLIKNKIQTKEQLVSIEKTRYQNTKNDITLTKNKQPIYFELFEKKGLLPSLLKKEFKTSNRP